MRLITPRTRVTSSMPLRMHTIRILKFVLRPPQWKQQFHLLILTTKQQLDCAQKPNFGARLLPLFSNIRLGYFVYLKKHPAVQAEVYRKLASIAAVPYSFIAVKDQSLSITSTGQFVEQVSRTWVDLAPIVLINFPLLSSILHDYNGLLHLPAPSAWRSVHIVLHLRAPFFFYNGTTKILCGSWFVQVAH